ncbi:MAG: DNA translocase FtsK [Candidatus Muirbacterium halophilum]|nr:DNA translocase FtsK [Candidatus Muirbacterium halophilum]
MNIIYRRQILGTILGGISILMLLLYYFGGESMLGQLFLILKNAVGCGVLVVSYFFWIVSWQVFSMSVEEEYVLDKHHFTLIFLAWILFGITFLIFAATFSNGGYIGNFIYLSFLDVFGKPGTLWLTGILMLVSTIITFNIDVAIIALFVKKKSIVVFEKMKEIQMPKFAQLSYNKDEIIENSNIKELIITDNNKEETNTVSKKSNKKTKDIDNSFELTKENIDDIPVSGMFDEKKDLKENESENEKTENKVDDKKLKKENKKKGVWNKFLARAAEDYDNPEDAEIENIDNDDSIVVEADVIEEDLEEETVEKNEKNKEKIKKNKDKEIDKSDENYELGDVIDEENDDIPQLKERAKIQIPTIDLLDNFVVKQTVTQEELKEKAERLLSTLSSFKIEAKVINMTIGPSVTRFELQLAPGIKVSKLIGLQNDIGVTLATNNIRIEAPIPGKSAIGIEIPNANPMLVPFREVVCKVQQKGHPLTIGLGKNINGEVMLFNIAKTPHLLIAGATGSGKSVCVNTIICSILFNAHPDDVKFIMVDPKMVELSMYNGIPHLLIPVITEPKKAAAALNWAVEEMESRYSNLADHKVKKIEEFNEKMDKLKEEDPKNAQFYNKIPYIIVIIDELADLMVVARNEVEESIMRIAQKARAVGMHLIIATQRPSVNVITGVIKANLPSRIAFSVQSQTDSRTIIDQKGAESLIGKGDMLYWPIGESSPERIQGAFVSNAECERIVKDWADQVEAQYDEEINQKIEAQVNSKENNDRSAVSGEIDKSDELFPEAVRIVVEGQKASISLLQRKLSVGHARAARLMDIMEDSEIVSKMNQRNQREILIKPEQIEEYV